MLRLDGNTYIEAGTNVNAMMGQSGTLETWCLPEEIRGGLISWHTGPNWPDARLVLGFVTYRDSRLIGAVADGVNSNGSSVREVVEKGKWAHFVLTFDGTNLDLFVNGELVRRKPQRLSPNLEGVPLRIGLGHGLGKPYFVGRMAEVRVYSCALSGELLYDGTWNPINAPGELCWSDATQGLMANELIWARSAYGSPWRAPTKPISASNVTRLSGAPPRRRAGPHLQAILTGLIFRLGNRPSHCSLMAGCLLSSGALSRPGAEFASSS